MVQNTFVHIACLVFLILIIYANIINAPFQWDEITFIVDNPLIKDLHYFSTPSDAKGLEHYDAFLGRYVGFLTFALNYRIHDLSVAGYHIVNIVIHIVNSILLYSLVLLTFKSQGLGTRSSELKTKTQGLPAHSRLATNQTLVSSPESRFIAFFSAALFAVHPLQTEAVTYVFQRLASLAAMYYLLALVMYVRARLEIEKKGSLTLTSALTFILSLISTVLAMKTKENSFTLPLIITLYELCFFTNPLTNFKFQISNLKFAVPFLLTLPIIPLTLMSLTGLHQLDPGAYGFKEFSRADYFFTQFRVIVTYLRLFFLPVNQNISYDYPLFKSFFDPQVLLSFIFLAVFLGFGLYLVTKKRKNTTCTPTSRPINGEDFNRVPASLSGADKREGYFEKNYREIRLIGFGILWFFITLSVESSIIPLPMLINEYRVYLPSVGLIVCVVTGALLLRKQVVTVFLLALVVAVLSVATHFRNELWTSRITLWEDTIQKSPGKASVHLSLGYWYQDLRMYDKAFAEYLFAVKLDPDNTGAHINLGSLYAQEKMYDRAIEEFMIAIRLSPDNAAAYNSLGIIYQTLDMSEKAMEQYLIAIRLKPDFPQARNNLGLLYQALNMPDKAIEQYLIAIRLKPDFPQAHNNLGLLYQALNMPDKAIEQYLIAIKLMPDYAKAHFNLGFTYYKIGQMKNAGRELISGLNLNPDNQQARQLLETIQR